MNVLRLPVLGFVLLALCGAGCATTRKAYYNSWEKFGYAKRERLVDDVKDARDEQAKAKEQFASALEQFRSVVNFDGGKLEPMYNKLDKEYQRCEARAGAVRSKTQTVKNVAGALFGEWQGEIGQIKDDPTLKDKSQALLDRTKVNYGEMIARMDAAAASMDPVLSRFKNRVLFIKHNLNAQAVASLKGTEVELGGEIENLIREMESSIAEADSFIAGIQPQKS